MGEHEVAVLFQGWRAPASTSTYQDWHDSTPPTPTQISVSISSIACDTQQNPASGAGVTLSPLPTTVPGAGTDHHTPMPSAGWSVYSALFENGRVLGIKCGCSVPSKSNPTKPDTPLSLQPTPLQLSTIHHLWIDRFPFPRLRDNFIMLSSLIDEEEFLADLFNLKSFEIREGGCSWDPALWKIGEDFEARWGYLFY